MSESRARSFIFKRATTGMFLIAVLQRGDGAAAHGAGRGVRDIQIGDAGQIGAVGIDLAV